MIILAVTDYGYSMQTEYPHFINNMPIKVHEHFMRLALQEAEKGLYFTKPNPAVGCVIVKDGQILATGYHHTYGADHAEVDALKKLNFQATSCDMYVTLEPCSHHGKTPPCVDAVIKADIKRVFIPFCDPNPLVYGKGVNQLKSHGIEVHQGILPDECRQLNRFFLHYMQHSQPYVIAKWAMTQDGALNIPGQRWISSEPAREHTHLMRQRIDAILIGAETLRKDNPLLTTRAPFIPAEKAKHPLRIILSSKADLPLTHHVLNDTSTSQTLIACTQPPKATVLAHCQKKHIPILLLAGSSVKEQLSCLLTYLANHHIRSLLVEGGQRTLQHFFAAQLVHEVQCYIASQQFTMDIFHPMLQQPMKILEQLTLANDTFICAQVEAAHV